MPRPGRESASDSRATPAIAAARMTLGSGVTRMTNPASANADAPTRASRGIPSAAAAAKTSPTMIAQFAPDTAVRWLSELTFIEASSAGVTALVSPIARPGSRPAPGPGKAGGEPAERCPDVAGGAEQRQADPRCAPPDRARRGGTRRPPPGPRAGPPRPPRSPRRCARARPPGRRALANSRAGLARPTSSPIADDRALDAAVDRAAGDRHDDGVRRPLSLAAQHRRRARASSPPPP